MRNKILFLLVLASLWYAFPLMGQQSTRVSNSVIIEKEKFLESFRKLPFDSSIIDPMISHVDTRVNQINKWIKNTKLPVLEKEKATRSFIYFIKELNNYVNRQKIDVYDIPGAFDSYHAILKALVDHQPVAPLLRPLGARRSQLMAVAFTQYQEYTIMDDVAVYKRVASSPEYILQFLENKPAFRYADSLLITAAAYNPQKIASYLNNERSGLQDRIRNTGNIYIRQIATLSGEKNASELLPFVAHLAEEKITPTEILAKRGEVMQYFQLLVNTLQQSLSSGTADPMLLTPLRNGIKQKSHSFYVHEINELHNSSDAVRFASVKGLRPQDIYYIITSSGEELYTSSYLGLYKRLMEYFKGQPADSLFDMVQHDNLRVFIRLAANYNVLGDFMRNLSPEKAKDILHQFISNIEKDENAGLEKAMDIADAFTATSIAPEISELIETELYGNLTRCRATQQYLGVRLYSILLQVFELVKQKDGIEKLWTTLGDYNILTHKALENKNGDINQLVLFYGDDDGIASFSNFLRLFTDQNKWKVSRNENWISVQSMTDKLVLYANRPLEIKDGSDLRAQDSLMMFLKEQSIEPSLLVHRGHSYHLDKTLSRLTPSVKLAVLGSCGSYNKAISIATINPDIQVIGSKKTGSKSINDPIIDVINESLMAGKDLNWPEIWKKLSARFSKDPSNLSLFNEYFPPSKNLGLFVLKLFNYHNRFV